MLISHALHDLHISLKKFKVIFLSVRIEHRVRKFTIFIYVQPTELDSFKKNRNWKL